jgi:hypothetical protein
MGLKTILVLAAFLQIAFCEIDTTGLTPEQAEIVENYEKIATLNYGDKCNYNLESKGDKVRENLKPFLKKVFVNAFKHGLSGSEDEFELSPSLEDARDELFAEIQEFTAKAQRSGEGICNDTKTLYCDQEIGECRCGKAKKPKGFTFTRSELDDTCKFDLGSGCIQTEFSELTDELGCKKGSTCVTAIDNAPCTFSNTFQEGLRNPSRFKKLVEMQGFACFCDKD